MGWNLEYGGQISRKVRGIPDERFYFTNNVNSSNSVSFFNQLSSSGTADISNRMSYVAQAKGGSKDYLPDEFYYSALGASGRFMYSQEQNKFILFPKEDLVVKQFNSAPNQYGTTFPFYFWNLKLQNGTSIDFGKEATISQVDPSGISTTKSCWLVKTIRNTYNDSIVYTYDNFSYYLRKIAGQEYKIYNSTNSTGLSGNYPTINFTQTTHNDALVSQIPFLTVKSILSLLQGLTCLQKS